LKEGQREGEDDEEDVSSFWMALRNKEYTEI
jgi:hypothetical protein